ncbi:chromosome segregation protein SMC [Bacillus toyonensis]|uniref:chromosome segregation protein SMC n=1 Tax=Bacillus toyonensis TaxID=155322 RepID=UPI00124BD9E4|nr:chromosome segregation protein SMC [Bacillus toyonensis]KAB2359642.1 chromosome segregation protein SMC [Bacillus toyonensis]
MTENEKKLLEQIYAKVCDMEKTVDRIDSSLNKVDSKMDNLNGETSTSVESKLDDLKSVNKGIQATFEQGFSDVHKGLAEIKEVKQIKKNGKQVH